LAGIFTGSWLGDLFDYLPPSLSFLTNLKNSLAVVDPLNDPLTMLIFSLGVGIVQILVGIMLAVVKEWKRGNYAVAIMDHLSWFVFLISIVMYIVGITASPLLASSGFAPYNRECYFFSSYSRQTSKKYYYEVPIWSF